MEHLAVDLDGEFARILAHRNAAALGRDRPAGRGLFGFRRLGGGRDDGHSQNNAATRFIAWAPREMVYGRKEP